eukprot:TRINITY_DN19356_c0_g1::TRINITY_DN19356_c0_g1_i1::g.7823::m.7823 TRINITY_DN19356_c0_g1::TRINITY_DN19356_c0_g1_i1::g.7823  ORF type:complete len:935 (+),score=274.27,sp/P70699/LYAG_MOUSE/38.43/0.0,Glyco_hydro_31/PF01055.21/6.2e-164,Gal_mutarotas_2/PF13802.1/1.3e-08 TRINITY_DN19356_c0_g1_i1:52-2805(+)
MKQNLLGLVLGVLVSFAYALPLSNIPSFHDVSSNGYYTLAAKPVQVEDGFTAQLNYVQSGSNVAESFGLPISQLQLRVIHFNDDTVQVKISDPATRRWEVPNIIQSSSRSNAENPQFSVSFSNPGEPFEIMIHRADGSDVVFQGQNLYFSDQYLQLRTSLPKDHHIYGLGERVAPLRLSPNYNYTIMATDQPTPDLKPLYGSHPYYLELRDGPDGPKAHGVLLLNSNPMDIELLEDSLTYKVVGGVLDLYLVLGPSVHSATQQYHTLIGKTFLPPAWSLGFHQCRWGYDDIGQVRDVVNNYVSNQLPLEAMWIDIDYMEDKKDFTFDPERYPESEVRALTDQLHARGQRLVLIIDPAIHIEEGYKTYESGLEQNVFIRKPEGQAGFAEGKVWPGVVHFPDFSNSNASQWWLNEIRNFHGIVPFDGLWIDMNEAASFCDGRCSLDHVFDNSSPRLFTCKCETVDTTTTHWNEPPYLPGAVHKARPCKSDKVNGLDCSSIDMASRSALGLEYDIHNLYGHLEALATTAALKTVRDERPFVLSRSTFPGTGHIAGHWLGDNYSTWKALQDSIPGMLVFQFFGIPYVGADICGFTGWANEELCSRWTQLGAFYPFSRNHNYVLMPPQEPWVYGQEMVQRTRNVLQTRYSLIAYYYSLFYRSHLDGGAVIRPMMYEFSEDKNTWTNQRQFLVGSGLLVSPVLEDKARTVDAYFPAASSWFDFTTGEKILDQGEQGTTLTLDAPLDVIPLHVRGGHAIPRQAYRDTVDVQLRAPMDIIVALEKTGPIIPYADEVSVQGGGSVQLSVGEVFVDSGVSMTPAQDGQYTHVKFLARSIDQCATTWCGFLVNSTITHAGFVEGLSIPLEKLTILNAPCPDVAPEKITATINGAPATVAAQKDGHKFNLVFPEGTTLGSEFSINVRCY